MYSVLAGITVWTWISTAPDSAGPRLATALPSVKRTSQRREVDARAGWLDFLRVGATCEARDAARTAPSVSARAVLVASMKPIAFVQVLGAIVRACEVCARHVATSVGR
eukprot:5879543-Pleurochrysis_carterae.AAC.2